MNCLSYSYWRKSEKGNNFWSNLFKKAQLI